MEPLLVLSSNVVVVGGFSAADHSSPSVSPTRASDVRIFPVLVRASNMIAEPDGTRAVMLPLLVLRRWEAPSAGTPE